MEALTRTTGLSERELEGEQLIEGEPIEGIGDVGGLLREVGRAQGVGQPRQSGALFDLERVVHRRQGGLEDPRQ